MHDLAEDDIAEDDQDHRQHRDQRKPHADVSQHGIQDQRQHDGCVEGGDDGHAQKLPDALEVVGKVRHQIAGLVGVEITGAEGFQMGEQIVAHFFFDGARGAEQEVSPPETSQDNDRAVMAAYGFDVKTMTESQCVAELFKLYQELTK